LPLSSREVATGETVYEIDVGGIFTLAGELISRLRAYPSTAEAEQALAGP